MLLIRTSFIMIYWKSALKNRICCSTNMLYYAAIYIRRKSYLLSTCYYCCTFVLSSSLYSCTTVIAIRLFYYFRCTAVLLYLLRAPGSFLVLGFLILRYITLYALYIGGHTQKMLNIGVFKAGIRFRPFFSQEIRQEILSFPLPSTL